MLEARQLSKTFHDRRRGDVVAVDQVSLTVESGTVYGLLGPNGAGKTTTLRILATLLRPDAGSVIIDGVDASAEPVKARSRLAYVPAEAGLPKRLTPLEEVALFARIQGVSDPRRSAESLLERLGAHDYMRRPCGSLSTGMKRRVVLARALVHDPQVLLLDEPTDGLDVAGRRDVLALVRQLAAGDGRAVVLCSHIMGEVENTCSRLGVVAQGKLVAEGGLDDLRSAAGTDDLSEAFVRLTSAEAAEDNGH